MVFSGNVLTNVANGFDFTGAVSVDSLTGNTINGAGIAQGVGVNVGVGSVVTVSDGNVISGFATGIKVDSGNATIGGARPSMATRSAETTPALL